MPNVKSPRRYDSPLRQAQARRTQETVLDAAQHHFATTGYAVTIGAIADEAGVSVDTIYKTFGGKPGLVRAATNEALKGRDRFPRISARMRCGYTKLTRKRSCASGGLSPPRSPLK